MEKITVTMGLHSATLYVTPEEAKRIVHCYDASHGCKGDMQAVMSAVAKHMIEVVADQVCTYERLTGVSPIVPKTEGKR